MLTRVSVSLTRGVEWSSDLVVCAMSMVNWSTASPQPCTPTAVVNQLVLLYLTVHHQCYAWTHVQFHLADNFLFGELSLHYESCCLCLSAALCHCLWLYPSLSVSFLLSLALFICLSLSSSFSASLSLSLPLSLSLSLSLCLAATLHMSVCVRVCVCACVRACMRACVRAYMCVCVSVCMSISPSLSLPLHPNIHINSHCVII